MEGLSMGMDVVKISGRQHARALVVLIILTR